MCTEAIAASTRSSFDVKSDTSRRPGSGGHSASATRPTRPEQTRAASAGSRSSSQRRMRGPHTPASCGVPGPACECELGTRACGTARVAQGAGCNCACKRGGEACRALQAQATASLRARARLRGRRGGCTSPPPASGCMRGRRRPGARGSVRGGARTAASARRAASWLTRLRRPGGEPAAPGRAPACRRCRQQAWRSARPR
jgi:hypothetical protein